MSTFAQSAAAASSAPVRKTFWDVILTSTPVLLTVLATLLAGLSSSEMTQAQYHRSLAAQNQSKAGDQWSFFQAKRIRGTNLEMTVDLLHAVSEPGQVGPEALRAVAALLPQQFHRIETVANRLRETLMPVQGTLGQAGEALQAPLDNLIPLARDKAREAEKAEARVTQVLAEGAVQDAFAYLTTAQVPQAKEVRIENSLLREALQAIDARQTEAETALLLAELPDDTLRQAIQLAEANVRALEEADQPISAELGRIEKLVQEQVALARSMQRAVRKVSAALGDLPATQTKDLMDLSSGAVALLRCADTVKTAVEELNNDFKAARHGYSARRYRNEARSNQEAAGLYEIQVRKSSLTSERHRVRSRHFFFGMLAAQAGVTIATLSLALRYKSILWTLASLAGLIAVSFALYVQLYM